MAHGRRSESLETDCPPGRSTGPEHRGIPDRVGSLSHRRSDPLRSTAAARGHGAAPIRWSSSPWILGYLSIGRGSDVATVHVGGCRWWPRHPDDPRIII